MICKNCGFQNVDGARFCVTCGEPLEETAGNVSQIFAFAGTGRTDKSAQSEKTVKVVSSMGRLRRTDVQPEGSGLQDESVIMEAKALLGESEEAWDVTEAYYREESEADPTGEAVPQSLADQAAAIVSRAVEKIVGASSDTDKGKESVEEEAPPDTFGAEDPFDQAQAAMESHFIHTIHEAPESPLNFTMEQEAEEETPEEEAAEHHFVRDASRSAVPVYSSRNYSDTELPEIRSSVLDEEIPVIVVPDVKVPTIDEISLDDNENAKEALPEEDSPQEETV